MSRPEHHRATCPYCIIGFALVTVYRNGSEVNLNLDDHPKCTGCKRYFRIQPRLKLEGVKIENFVPRLPRSPQVGAN